jgi:hypothetical protein
MTRRAFPALLALLPLAAAGCGKGGGAAGPAAEDQAAIAELLTRIEGMNDPRAAAKYFAAGAALPADRLRKLAGYSVVTAGRPAVSGDTATARLKLVVNRTGQEAGEVEWTFVKEGGAWKIKTAPLP